MANRHVIGKLFWELRLDSSQNTYAIQQEISDMVWKSLVPELNEIFDRIAGEDEVLTFNKIIMDIGSIDVKDVASPEIMSQITKHLEEECFRAKYLQQSANPAVDGKGDIKGRRTPEAYYFDLWLYWLKNGTLPPYSLAPDDHWMEWVLRALGMYYRAVDKLEVTLRRYPMAIRRLIMQHGPNELQAITELYTGHVQSGLLDLLGEMKRLLEDLTLHKISSYRDLEIGAWNLIFDKVILRREKLDTEALQIWVLSHPPYGMLAFESKMKQSNFPILKKLVDSWGEALKIEKVSLQNEADLSGVESPEWSKPGSPEDMATGTQYFFNNAGMVLLHPFLLQFFRKLKLVDGDVFKDVASQCRAVLLLQYLTTSQEKVRDYAMVLPKLLCAMPLNLPLDHSLQLSDVEKEEATTLLRVVIDHWGALGNTSPDGLREGFLIRDGKLLREQGGWRLYVEQKAMDLLLDRLPWNLSMIKLPWMKEILKVEWR